MRSPQTKESSEYIDFYKKQWVPKHVRKLGSKIFNMIGRDGTQQFKNTEKYYEALPQERKDVIKLKFELNKINKELHAQQTTIKEFRKKAGFLNITKPDKIINTKSYGGNQLEKSFRFLYQFLLNTIIILLISHS